MALKKQYVFENGKSSFEDYSLNPSLKERGILDKRPKSIFKPKLRLAQLS